MKKTGILILFFLLATMTTAMASFVDNGDGTVTDQTSSLMWQQKTGGSMTWDKADTYCKNLSLAGHDDWRLPTLDELKTLLDTTATNPSIDTTFFPDTSSAYYWTSTLHFFPDYAWVLDFTVGDVYFDEKINIFNVRAVRSVASTGPPQAWYADVDKDGFGNPAQSQFTVNKPLGYVLDNTDCNDNDPSIYPGAPEIPGDGIDQDCDGTDAPAVFAGILTSDVNGGLAPVTVKFTTFIAKGLAPFTYDYDFGDSTPQAGGTKSQSHTYQAAGTYTAKVTVTDAAKVTYALQKTIIVSDTQQINQWLDILQTNADQMKTAAQSSTILGLLNDSANIAGKLLNAVSNAVTAVKSDVQTKVQTRVETLVTNTHTILSSLVQGGGITALDLINISESLKEVVSQLIKNGVPLTDKTLIAMEAISGTLYAQTLDDLLKNSGLTQAQIDELKTDKTKAQAFFLNNPHLLTGLAGSTGIDVGGASDFDPDDVETLAATHGLTDQQTGLLFNAVEKTIDVNQKISSTAGISTKTIAEIAEEIFTAYYGKSVVQTIVESITQNLLMEFADGTYVSLIVKSVKVVEDFMPQGLFDLPNGNKLGITEAYALEFVSYPVFPMDFSAEVIKMGLNPYLSTNGAIQVQFDQLLSLSLKMGWDYFTNVALSSLTTAFSVTGGTNPAAEAYSLLVTYDTGKSQLLPPTIMALEALTEWLDSVIPGKYSVNADTGAITVDTAKFKPDYVFESLTSIDYTGILAAGGIQEGNLAFAVSDFNGDGVLDLKFYSDDPMGAQILYTVP